MSEFKLVTEFTPKGDQPQAIEALVEGIERGDLAIDAVALAHRHRAGPAGVLEIR